MRLLILVLSVILIGAACKKDKPACGSGTNEITVIKKDGRKLLWGGEDASWHFDITDWSLNECQLHYGLGREAFPALIEPKYESVQEAASRYNSVDRFMIVLTDTRPMVYSISLLIRHEVINDTADGHPIMVAYCVLADLAAVYTRIYCGQEFTFALSGYTYFDKDVWGGLDGFVMWDRETESLWWPLIDQAVSGSMKERGVRMEKYNETKWEETTWGQIINDHPDARVLKTGQTMNPPQNWPQYEASSLNCN